MESRALPIRPGRGRPKALFGSGAERRRLQPRLDAVRASAARADVARRQAERLAVAEPQHASSIESATVALCIDSIAYIRDPQWRRVASSILEACKDAHARRAAHPDGRT